MPISPDHIQHLTKLDNPDFDKATDKAAQAKEDFVGAGFVILDQLAESVATMKLASRFSPTQKPIDFIRVGSGSVVHPLFLAQTESGAKKFQLTITINRLKQKLLEMGSDIELLVLDIEASKQD